MMLAWIKEQAGSEGGKEYDLRIKFSVYILPIFVFCFPMIHFVILHYIACNMKNKLLLFLFILIYVSGFFDRHFISTQAQTFPVQALLRRG